MGITIGEVSNYGAASDTIASALQAQVATAEIANVEALFGSLGLGSNFSSTG